MLRIEIPFVISHSVITIYTPTATLNVTLVIQVGAKRKWVNHNRSTIFWAADFVDIASFYSLTNCKNVKVFSFLEARGTLIRIGLTLQYSCKHYLHNHE